MDSMSSGSTGSTSTQHHDGASSELPHAEAPPPPPPTGAEALNLRPGLAPDLMRQRIVAANRHIDATHRVMAFYLVEADECRYFILWGHPSIESFAKEVLGFSRRTTRDLLRAGKKLQTLPAIDADFANGKLKWSAVRELVKVVVPEHEEQWLDEARKVSQRKLEELVATHREGDAPRAPKKGIPNNKTRVVLMLETMDRTKYENLRRSAAEAHGLKEITDAEFIAIVFERFLNAVPSGNAPIPHTVALTRCPDCDTTSVMTEDGPESLNERAAFHARINAEPIGLNVDATDDSTAPHPQPGSPEDVDPPTPTRLRQQILKRDGHTCTACHAKANLQVHHIVWRSRGGKNLPTNLVAVCARCHALIHDGFLSIQGDAPNKLNITRSATKPSDTEPLSTAWMNTITSAAKEDVKARPYVRSDFESMKEMAKDSPISPAESTEPSVRNDGQGALNTGGLDSMAGSFRPFNSNDNSIDQHGTGQPAAIAPPLRTIDQKAFDHLQGVARNVASLRRTADSAVKRQCAMTHVLLGGPAGLGKSTLARATAAYLGTECREVNATAFETVREFVDALRAVAPYEVFFIDEIQDLRPRLMTALLSAMQDGKVTVPPDGSGGIPEHVRINPITIIGATTDPDRLSNALRSRFGSIEEMTRYDSADIVDVVKAAAKKESFTICDAVAERIAFHSDGIPRTALAFFVKARDVAMGTNEVDLRLDHLAVAEREAGIDAVGLRPQERELVKALTNYGCLARSKVASLIGMSLASVRDLIEPALIRKGVLTITPRGLRLTPKFGPTWARSVPARAMTEFSLV